MAKRVSPDEKPYRPVDDALVRSVLNPEPATESDEQGEGTEPPQVFNSGQSSPKLFTIQGRKGQQEHEPPKKVEKAPESSEKLTREKRVLLTASEEREIERIVDEMAEGLGTSLKLSHVLRASVTLICNAREELIKQSRKAGPLKRPPNGDTAAVAVFEHYLAQLIETAFRNTRPLE
jgi:hypothetical protein